MTEPMGRELALFGVGYFAALLTWWLVGKFKRTRGDGLIHCPECGTTKLARLPFGIYATHFECENGHRFSQVVPE